MAPLIHQHLLYECLLHSPQNKSTLVYLVKLNCQRRDLPQAAVFHLPELKDISFFLTGHVQNFQQFQFGQLLYSEVQKDIQMFFNHLTYLICTAVVQKAMNELLLSLRAQFSFFLRVLSLSVLTFDVMQHQVK